MIELKNISKSINSGENTELILKNINLKIDEGELVAIMGDSGAGKSTLLNVMAGLSIPTSGDYIFKDKKINFYIDKELTFFRNKQMGYIVQNYALINDISVFENIELPLLFDKEYNKHSRKEIIMKYLDMFKLASKKNMLVRDLSGGEKQRVAIARAIVNNKNIILADEPTGALDEMSSLRILDILLDLNKNGKTIVIVTHNKEIACKCKRIITLKDGNIISDTKM